MTIKSHEDKTFIGAFIASLTLPWGFSVSDDVQGASYHFVWARDMYEQVTGLLAAGDRGSREQRGHLAVHASAAPGWNIPAKLNGRRNALLRPTCKWTRSRFPIILAWQMNRTDDATWNGISKAANAIVANGAYNSGGALGGNGRLSLLQPSPRKSPA